MRRPAAQGRGGTVAQTLRRRLERHDKAWDEQVPDDGVEDLPAKSLRKIAAALEVKQGDRTKSALLEAIMHVQAQRHALLDGTWQSASSDSEGSGLEC